MECPFCAGELFCDYAVECEILTAAFDEAEDLRVALNNSFITLLSTGLLALSGVQGLKELW